MKKGGICGEMLTKLLTEIELGSKNGGGAYLVFRAGKRTNVPANKNFSPKVI